MGVINEMGQEQYNLHMRLQPELAAQFKSGTAN
jgi:hypothetical protein